MVRCGFKPGSHGPEQASGRQEVKVSDSDLVEIAKRNGEFRKNYGPWLGALLIAWTSHLATRSRPILRTGWLLALAGVIFSVWRHWRS